MSSTGAALEGDAQIEAQEAATCEKNDESVKMFTPGEG